MKPIIWGLIAAIVVLIATNFYTYFKQVKPEMDNAAYWRNEKFKTDTMRIENTYTKYYPLPTGEAIPPQIVKIYLPDTTSKHMTVGFDTLGFINVVDSVLKTRTQISRSYVTQYPKANKLLAGMFKKDTISLDLLGIDGQIKREIYPINLGAFSYQYLNNSFRATELSASEREKPAKKKFISYDGTYLNYDHDFVNKNRNIMINGSFNIGNRFKVGGFADQPLVGSKDLRAGVRGSYRLF